jgi:SAM-dependent methyltransferase
MVEPACWSETVKAMPTSEKSPPEFDRYAPSYTELLDDPVRNRFARDPLHFHRRKWILIESLLRRAGLDLQALKWLDVGCGRGELLELAGINFRQAMGCDPSSNMLSPDTSFKMYKQPSLVELPFADNSVDFVTAVCVYHHVHGEARTLLTDEIRRVLAPGGLCCIVEHNPWNPVTLSIVKRCPVDVDAELLTAQAASRLFEASGFEALETDYFLYFPEWLFNSRVGALEKGLHWLPFGGQYASLTRNPA